MRGKHITLRNELGLLKSNLDEELNNDLNWQAEVLNRVLEQGGFAGEDFHMDNFHGRARDERGDVEVLVTAAHRFVAHTPAALTCTALVDMVGDENVQNQPGTAKEQYPNWCVPLRNTQGDIVLIDDLNEMPLFHKIAEASHRPAPTN